ncbi:MAG: glycosyltransferase family 25 protein [Ahrensia sp.]|nr:glycosyltransferase family 25 protein [Ahrensia sp.]
MSQRKAWQAIVASGDRHGIVFEDDILFGRDSAEIFADFSWMPQDIHLLRLETVLRHTVHDAKPITTILNRDIVRLRHVLLGAGAYIISAHAAAHLLEITAKFTYACDYVLFDPTCDDFCCFDVFQMVPAICIQSAVAKKPDLPSILGPMRKEMFYKGRVRFIQNLSVN